MHMRHQCWGLSNFVYYKANLQLSHNIVIVVSLNHLTIGETQYDPLSSPKLSLLPPKALLVLSIFIQSI